MANKTMSSLTAIDNDTLANDDIVHVVDTSEGAAGNKKMTISELDLRWSTGGISEWVTSTDYEVDDVVHESNLIYKCLEIHTSGTFATDLAANKWIELSASSVSGTIDIDAAQLEPALSTPAHSEGLMFYDKDAHTLAVYNDSPAVTHQVGQEMLVRVENNDSSTILDGQVVYLESYNNGPRVKKAVSTVEAIATRVIGIATEDILQGEYGYITFAGVVNNVDTTGGAESWAQGDLLYLSDTAGVLTNIHVESPDWDVHMGYVVQVHASTGKIGVRINIGGNDISTFNLLNGTFLQARDTGLKTDGVGGILFTLEKEGGGDLDIYFDGKFSNFPCVDASTCTASDPNCANINLGTDAVPVLNYVYVLESTNLLTVNTSGWPSGVGYSAVSTVFAQSQAGVLADGPYKQHVWTDHLNSEDTGHMGHVNKWIRNQNATWVSGAAPTFTGTGTGSITAEFTAGTVFQLHEHPFGVQTGPATMWLTNESGVGYKEIDNINDITADSEGVSLASRTYGLVFWGSVNETTSESKVFVNLPAGSYAKAQPGLVRSDLDSFQDFSIPIEFKGTGFLIARMVVDEFSGTYTIYSGSGDDLRGKLPNTSAGGSTGIGTEFPDSLFRIFDTTDVTKELAIECSGITTGNTRTLTVPDADGTIVTEDGSGVVTITNGITNADSSHSSSERFGASAAVTGANSVAVGNGASAPLETVTIGANNTVNALSTRSVIIGSGNFTTTTGCVAIGYSVQVGNRATSLGYNTTATGDYSIAIGDGSSTGQEGSITIGRAAVSTAVSQMVIGGTGEINDSYIGNGVTNAAPANTAINATGGSGTDVAGANMTVAGGKGTGSGAGGAISFKTADPGSTGSTLNALVEQMRIDDDGAIHMPTLPTGNPAVAGQLWNNSGVLTVSAG